MFIECWGASVCPVFMIFLLCCLYIDVKENIICQNLRFFLLFMESLPFQKPNAPSIISNISQAVVTAVTACVSEPTILLRCCGQPYNFNQFYKF